jgi:hypothetical protein
MGKVMGVASKNWQEKLMAKPISDVVKQLLYSGLNGLDIILIILFAVGSLPWI